MEPMIDYVKSKLAEAAGQMVAEAPDRELEQAVRVCLDKLPEIAVKAAKDGAPQWFEIAQAPITSRFGQRVAAEVERALCGAGVGAVWDPPGVPRVRDGARRLYVRASNVVNMALAAKSGR